MSAGTREVLPGPVERSSFLLVDAGCQVLPYLLVVGTVQESMVAIVCRGLTPVATAIRVMSEAEEVHVGSIVACDELGHQGYLPAAEVASPLERTACKRLHCMQVPPQIREVPLGGGVVSVDTANDAAKCRGVKRKRLGG